MTLRRFSADRSLAAFPVARGYAGLVARSIGRRWGLICQPCSTKDRLRMTD